MNKKILINKHKNLIVVGICLTEYNRIIIVDKVILCKNLNKNIIYDKMRFNVYREDTLIDCSEENLKIITLLYC